MYCGPTFLVLQPILPRRLARYCPVARRADDAAGVDQHHELILASCADAMLAVHRPRLVTPHRAGAGTLAAARISATIADAIAGCSARACSCFDSAEFLGVLVDQQGVAANCWADPANAWTGPGVGIKSSSGRSPWAQFTATDDLG